MKTPAPSQSPAATLFEIVPVSLGERSYAIHIGQGLLQREDSWGALPRAHDAVLITCEPVAQHYGAAWMHTLLQRFAHCQILRLADGEALKSWEVLDSVFEQMLRAGCTRQSLIFALGGGVIGDLAGFAAACYMRGVPFVQVPTTLLAMVDSSVGGKTAINHARGKNMVGAFWQPARVLADIDTLATLPAREWRCGLAEIIKYGFIADETFLVWLEEHLGSLLARDPASVIHAVKRSCEIKAAIVAQDERETSPLNLRAALNFGHTFAHAIEGETHLAPGRSREPWLHGEAVAAGMVMAADLSVRLGMLDSSAALRLRNLLLRAALPVQGPPGMTVDAYRRWMRVDKKADSTGTRFILLDSIGHTQIRPAPDALLGEVIAACSGTRFNTD